MGQCDRITDGYQGRCTRRSERTGLGDSGCIDRQIVHRQAALKIKGRHINNMQIGSTGQTVKSDRTGEYVGRVRKCNITVARIDCHRAGHIKRTALGHLTSGGEA